MTSAVLHVLWLYKTMLVHHTIPAGILFTRLGKNTGKFCKRKEQPVSLC